MEEWFQTFSYQKWRGGFQICSHVLWVILPLVNDWLWCFHCKGLLLSWLMILFFLPPLLSNFFSNCDASICPWLPLRCNHFDNIAQHFSFIFCSTWLEDWKNGKLVTPSDVIATTCHSAENMGKSAKHNQVCQGTPPSPAHTFYEGVPLCRYMERGIDAWKGWKS